MPSTHLSLCEEDIIKLILEFLQKREMSISQLSIERETGVVNGLFSDDLLFLRQLVLDGQWDDAIDFVQPLCSISEFDAVKFKFIVLKHKYLELLCIRSETGGLLLQPPTMSQYGDIQMAVDEVVKCLHELEKVCPSKESYSELCLLLTLSRISDHSAFKNWNPSNSRINCFLQIKPLIIKFLPIEKKVNEAEHCAQSDRLVQLLMKGILYESCVTFCQQKATSPHSNQAEIKFQPLLSNTTFSDSDLSLLSWLESVPHEIYSCPFEQKTLSINVDKLEKPVLEAAWTEQILVTPIKPKRFPHSAMPYSKSKSIASELMSRSLAPNIEGLLGSNKHLMTMSVGDIAAMSRSFAGFHLSNKKSMNTSVDRLFSEGDVFSNSYADLPSIMETRTKSTSSSPVPADEKKDVESKEAVIVENDSKMSNSSVFDMSLSKCDLLIEFQRQKQVLLEELDAANKKISKESKQLANLSSDNKLQEDGSCNRTPTGQIAIDHENLATSTPRHDNVHRRHLIDGPPVASPIMRNGHYSSTPSTYDKAALHAAKNLGNAMENVTNANVYTSPNDYYSPPPQRDAQCSYRQHQLVDNSSPGSTSSKGAPEKPAPIASESGAKPKFVPVTSLEDVQAIRAAAFHPNGKIYAIGSNSKTLRVCGYPKLTSDLQHDHEAYQPTVLFKRTKHHKGSIYCLAWNATGDLIATGSNDKSIKLTKFNSESCSVVGSDSELNMHDGTVRDVIFVEDMSNRSNLLISGGAGDCKVYITDCETATPFQAMSGHSGHILSLYTWGGAMFVSGSQDRTVRFWDLRTRGCVNVVSPPSASGSGPGSAVASVCVDPSGRLLVSGQEDSACMLYDIRGGRIIQTFRPHRTDVRTVRFSPSALYLLTGSYDHKVVLTDLQGDLTGPLPSVIVAEHSDKVIQTRWHPKEFSFLTTSADKTATLWALPPP